MGSYNYLPNTNSHVTVVIGLTHQYGSFHASTMKFPLCGKDWNVKTPHTAPPPSPLNSMDYWMLIQKWSNLLIFDDLSMCTFEENFYFELLTSFIKFGDNMLLFDNKLWLYDKSISKFFTYYDIKDHAF